MLEDGKRQYAARHSTMIDDNRRTLAAMQASLRDRLTSTFQCQGRLAAFPPTESAVEQTGDLARSPLATLLGTNTSAQAKTEAI
jgi:hypothetical protein